MTFAFTEGLTNSRISYDPQVVDDSPYSYRTDRISLLPVFENGLRLGGDLYTEISAAPTGGIILSNPDTGATASIAAHLGSATSGIYTSIGSRGIREYQNDVGDGFVGVGYTEDRASVVVDFNGLPYYRDHEEARDHQVEIIDRENGNVEFVFRYIDIDRDIDSNAYSSNVGFVFDDASYVPAYADFAQIPARTWQSTEGNTGVEGVWQFRVAEGALVLEDLGTPQVNAVGTNYNDELFGGYSADDLQGLGGNDTLIGNFGDDTMSGGAGDDLIQPGRGADDIATGAGRDIIEGSLAELNGDLVRDLEPSDTILISDLVIAGDWRFSYDGTSTWFLADTNGDDQENFALQLEGAFIAGDLIVEQETQQTYWLGSDQLLIGLRSQLGQDGDDYIDGNDLNNVISALSGDDFVFGWGGDDLILPGLGMDTLSSGVGRDTIEGTIDELDGDHIIDLSAQDIVRITNVSADVTWRFEATQTNTTVYFERSGDVIGQISFDGSDLFDVVGAERHGSTLLMGYIHINNSHIGNDLGNVIEGSSTRGNVVQGLGGDDLLRGGFYAETLEGGLGQDTLEGGGGRSDTFRGTISELHGDIITDFTFGDEILIRNASFGDRIQIVDHGTGSRIQADSQNTGFSDFYVEIADISADELILNVAQQGDDLLLTNGGFFGTDGNDQFGTSNSDNSVLAFGFGGDDTLGGSDVDDTIYGGAGNDTLQGYAGSDELHGGDGNDYIIVGWGNIRPGPNSDTVYGGDGADTIVGDSGDDLLIGGESTADIADRLFGNAGNDTIFGGYGNDELRGEDGNDLLNGGFGGDFMVGGAGADTLSGGASGDNLIAGTGDDFLNGGFGYDRLNGGDGADLFYHHGSRSHGADWIQDYDAAEGDRLFFGNSDIGPNAFQVNFGHAAAGAGDTDIQEAFVLYVPDNRIVWALVDGAAQHSIWLETEIGRFDLLC